MGSSIIFRERQQDQGLTRDIGVDLRSVGEPDNANSRQP